MPDECPSIRSMARWVLPVLVGPSTAVTPAPRRRPSRVTGDENEIGIRFPGWGGPLQRADTPCVSQCDAGQRALNPWERVWNEPGPNRRLWRCAVSFTATSDRAFMLGHNIR